MRTIQQRFEEKFEPVTESGCWIWTAGLKGKDEKQSYGLFRVGSRIRKAHQVSWEIYKGEIPKGSGYHGTCVCHQCDTPSCVNPDHLFLGTMRDNNDDKTNKHRVPRGSNHHSTTLTEKQVMEIKSLSTSKSQKELAAMFGVSRQNIGSIQNSVTWSHVNVSA